MIGFETAISGMLTADRAMQLIGTNIANANTPGYRRQEPILGFYPIQPLLQGMIGGVEIVRVRRLGSDLLTGEIARQGTEIQSNLQELEALQTIEAMLGRVGEGGLSDQMDGFMSALIELAADPSSSPLRSQVVWAADNLARSLQMASQGLTAMATQMTMELQAYVDQANGLAEQIAHLNAEISQAFSIGGSAATLESERDQLITELSELMDLQFQPSTSRPGSVTLSAWGKTLLEGTDPIELTVGQDADGNWGISAAGSSAVDANISGGRIGAVVNLRNTIIPSLMDSLDLLAGEVIQAVNTQHVYGIGTTGSFTQLLSEPVGVGPIRDWTTDVSGGNFFVRVTDPAGAVTRHAVNLNVSTDTAADVAAALDAIPGVSASIADGRIQILADSGYSFDFQPALLPEPLVTNMPGTSTPIIGGTFADTTNRVIRATVVGDGDIGVDDDLFLDVRNGAGDLITRVNIGLGYGPGQELDLGYGLTATLGAGTVSDGDFFTFAALASSDPTGFLAAAGLNTFFRGSTASDISVRQDMLDNPGRLALAIDADGTDARGLERIRSALSAINDDLGSMSAPDFLRSLVASVGQEVSIREGRNESLESVMGQLEQRRDEMGGVDVNQEIANMLTYQNMFEAMAKVLAVQNEALQTLFGTL